MVGVRTLSPIHPPAGRMGGCCQGTAAPSVLRITSAPLLTTGTPTLSLSDTPLARLWSAVRFPVRLLQPCIKAPDTGSFSTLAAPAPLPFPCPGPNRPPRRATLELPPCRPVHGRALPLLLSAGLPVGRGIPPAAGAGAGVQTHGCVYGQGVG